MPSLSAPVGKGCPNRAPDARLVQQLLDRFRPSPQSQIKVDGKVGPRTVAAIEQFQKTVVKMKKPDGIVSPGGLTLKTLSGGQLLVDRVAWGAKVTDAFKIKLLEITRALELNPDFLMAAMAFESAETFSPSIKNAAGSGAVGLIQFMPSTAKALGTTIEALEKMTAVDQLNYVRKYFAPRHGRLHSIEDVYMAILYPAAIGKPSDNTLFESGTKVYKQNKGLDANNDGKITIQEAAAAVRKKYERGLGVGFLR
jgi:peptidoglycan hydrolase-like protein with peptidoglycan-binding domain